MTFKEKIDQLRALIDNSLGALIDSDFVLWDLPYHSNIGDLLIWEGELSFLGGLKHNLMESRSRVDWSYKPLSEETIILLHGGGNFGDVWDYHQEFRCKIIESYPSNRIIILPQSVHYSDRQNMICDAEVFSKHPQLTICARDRVSYDTLVANFTDNNILMLPDMAFCIPSQSLLRHAVESGEKSLFLKRTDKELAAQRVDITPHFPLTVADWPTFGTLNPTTVSLKFAVELYKLGVKIPNLDRYVANSYKQRLIKRGVRFVTEYREIFTTRLHVMILAILLHRSVEVLDNSYGKNSRYYLTWLSDLDGVNMVGEV
ncbi:MAG: polysaccharide pyruvyl transferase family protein [Rikenellaceae bacterium]